MSSWSIKKKLNFSILMVGLAVVMMGFFSVLLVVKTQDFDDSLAKAASAGRDVWAAQADVLRARLESAVHVMTFAACLLGFMGVLIIVAMRAVSRSITNSVSEMMDAVKRLSEGDMNILMDSHTGTDELGLLYSSMGRMASSFNGMINRVTGSSNKVISTVEELKHVAAKTAENAQNQAMQASQTATASEEMSQTINEIAKRAAEVSESAHSALKTAEEGKSGAKAAVEASARVYESTRNLQEKIEELNKNTIEIGQVVSVITEIADQTNLLALNASIEAARASQYGRGFAVVADEVRKLAEKTIRETAVIAQKIKSFQAGTVETTNAMRASADEVRSATENIKRVGNSLEEIVRGSQTVRDRITEIATAVDEQSSVASQITDSMAVSSSISKDMDSSSDNLLSQVDTLTGIARDLRNAVSGFSTAEAKGD